MYRTSEKDFININPITGTEPITTVKFIMGVGIHMCLSDKRNIVFYDISFSITFIPDITSVLVIVTVLIDYVSSFLKKNLFRN